CSSVFVGSRPSRPPSFFFNDPAATDISTLSLHDALPIFAERDHEVVAAELGDAGAAVVRRVVLHGEDAVVEAAVAPRVEVVGLEDRKSTRLNSSHVKISYAVFCLKKKKKKKTVPR